MRDILDTYNVYFMPIALAEFLKISTVDAMLMSAVEFFAWWTIKEQHERLTKLLTPKKDA